MTRMSPMLSLTSEYALRAILYLARSTEQEPISADVIAEALGAPRNYLSKTLNALAKKGLVGSTRGPHGGFRLRQAPDVLTIAEVIHAVDEPRTRSSCLLGGQPCDDEFPCGAHYRWKAVSEEMWAPLTSTTIAELLQDEVPVAYDAGNGAGNHRPTAIPVVQAIT